MFTQLRSTCCYFLVLVKNFDRFPILQSCMLLLKKCSYAVLTTDTGLLVQFQWCRLSSWWRFHCMLCLHYIKLISSVADQEDSRCYSTWTEIFSVFCKQPGLSMQLSALRWSCLSCPSWLSDCLFRLHTLKGGIVCTGTVYTKIHSPSSLLITPKHSNSGIRCSLK